MKVTTKIICGIATGLLSGVAMGINIETLRGEISSQALSMEEVGTGTQISIDDGLINKVKTVIKNDEYLDEIATKIMKNVKVIPNLKIKEEDTVSLKYMRKQFKNLMFNSKDKSAEAILDNTELCVSTYHIAQCGEMARILLKNILQSNNTLMLPIGTKIFITVVNFIEDNHAFVRVVLPDGYIWKKSKNKEIIVDAWGSAADSRDLSSDVYSVSSTYSFEDYMITLRNGADELSLKNKVKSNLETTIYDMMEARIETGLHGAKISKITMYY